MASTPTPSRASDRPAAPSTTDRLPPASLARFCRYALPLVAWMGFIFVMSTRAGAAEHTASLIGRILHGLAPGWAAGLSARQLDLLNLLVRKAGHVTEYAILTVLAVRAFQRDLPGWRWRSGLGAVALSLLYAASDEWHQHFVPGRTAAIADVGIDAIGVTLAILCCWAWYRRATLRHREQRVTPLQPLR